MSNAGVDERRVVPEYEFEQYFPERDELSAEEQARLREQHGYFRTFFRTRPDRFRSFQRSLNQARLGVTFDIYLAKWARYAVGATVLGLVAGVLLTIQLASVGAFGFMTSLGLPDLLAGPIGEFRVAIAGALLTGTLAGLLGGGTALGAYYYPRLIVGARRRSIDVLLPHSIVYMYALSYGGMNTFEVIRELAEAEEVYGAVSEEFDMIVRDVELFGNDLFTAIRDARNLTPSDNLEQFLDDMLSVLDSGSDITEFLEGESETYMEEARQEQDDFLETLSILSEVFVVAFVAAPLFLIVTLIVISLLGSDSLGLLYLLVYVFLPAGMIMFLIMVDVLSNPYAQETAVLAIEEEDDDSEVPPGAEADPNFEAYEELKRREELLEAARNPIQRIRDRTPLLSLVLTVPVAVAVVGSLVGSGALDLSMEALVDDPVNTTIGLAVVPFYIVAVPLTLFYEAERRRERRIEKRFPDTLNILSSANQMGIRLTESLDLVARWSDGIMAQELRKVRNDITWNYDVERALLKFANRLEVPQVTRTMKLIAKGSRSSGDLARVISIAAEDTRNRAQIEAKRRQAMSAYIAIVVIGFLVYLAVILLINNSYLEPISQLTDEAAQAQGSLQLSVTQVNVEAFRTVFFHSALIQGVGAGLLAGKLAENDALAGLKYSLVLVTVAVAVFLFI